MSNTWSVAKGRNTPHCHPIRVSVNQVTNASQLQSILRLREESKEKII